MYAVIFIAEINELDQSYADTAVRMRELAMSKYGCTDFTAVTQGDREIAISYWQNEDQIKAWKTDPEHREAQEMGRTRWYKSWQVQVVKVEREYGSG